MTNNSKTTLTGRVLKVTEAADGYPVIQLDNGPVMVINFVTSADKLPDLLLDDLPGIRDHLMIKRTGRFRVKRR